MTAHMSPLIETTPQLEQMIRSRLAGRVHDLRVSRAGERLVIEGRSRTFYVKQLAQQAALEIAPEESWLNEIRVERAAQTFADF